MINIRIKNIKIHPDEILINEIFIDNTSFIRYYHHNVIPTRYFASRNGDIYSEISDVIMKPGTNKSGYFVVGLRFKNRGKPKYIQVHKIIATIFCNGYQKGLVVDHINGKKKDNNAYNLEWVTSSINSKRAYNNNLHKKYMGEKNPACIYPDELIHQASLYLQNGKSVKEVSDTTGISIATIHKLIAGKNRADITSQYQFPKSLYKGPNKVLSDEIKKEIIKLYINNVPAKDIQKVLNIDSLSRIYHAIYDVKRKCKGSTTIDQL